MRTLPYVVLHNAVSLDGRLLEWDMVDMGLYYGLVGTFQEQATLAGADTILQGAAHEGVAEDPPGLAYAGAASGDSRPLLIVPDSRGRVRIWRWMLAQSYWKSGVALCSAITPQEHLDYLVRSNVDSVVVGSGHVDLVKALEILVERYRIERIRIDSGGTLNGLLLRLGLVSEVSLLVAPVLMGDDRSKPFYRAPETTPARNCPRLRLKSREHLDGDYLWLRYEVLSRSQERRSEAGS